MSQQSDPPAHAGPVVVRGTGSIGMRHLRVLQALGVPAIAWPQRPERASVLAAEGWPVRVEPIARPATIVATDTSRHFSDIQEALTAGSHVLVEKPITPTAEGLGQLARLAHQADRKVFVACPLRFANGLQLVRQELPSLGRVHTVRIECQSYLPDWRPERDFRQTYAARAGEGGVLRDLIHEIDYAIWLFGQPEQVYAQFQDGSRLGIEAETGADLLWRAPGDVAVSLRLDYLGRQPRRRLHVTGANGELSWDAVAQTTTLSLVGATPLARHCPQDRDAMMAAQTTAFLQGIAGGNAGVLSTLAEGAFAIQLCDAARQSAATERPERMAPWHP